MDVSQLLKGVLDVAVLAVVKEEDGYGYDVLRRLYLNGSLTSYVVPSDEGPHRKYYAINDAGRSVLEESIKTWRGFADSIDQVLKLTREVAA
ncbi:MAG TPA: PadR family transcriptional regulator [Actinomycetota bacterium]|nr:PadR family transcriptional regulator [Actinomycetota bacterium]